MIKWTIFIGLFAYVAAYWGEIPDTREVVEISVEHNQSYPHVLSITLHSPKRGRIILDLEINSDVITEVTKVYVITKDKRTDYKPHTPCHYRGVIRNITNSSVILSSCSGTFRGSIGTDTDTLYLTRQENQYVIFSDSELTYEPEELIGADYNNSQVLKSKFKDEELSERFKRGITAGYRTLEVVIVTDRALWNKFYNNITEVEEFAISTINNVDLIYRGYGIRLAVVGIEVWRSEDLIRVTPQYAETLRNFTLYRQEKLLNIYRGHDVSILMTGVDFDGPVIGYAMVNNMCRSSTCNVNFNSKSNPKYFATVIAHEIGHNFGMDHDTDDCACEESSCVMSGSLGAPLTKFSSCSQTVLREYRGSCLLNTPKKLWGDPKCGNGFVEDGEECDCGGYEECVANDPCCQPTGCKLKPESECYTGECCKSCRFRSYKTMCRPLNSECDLVEYCTGTDSQCPVNRFKQDGSACALGSGLCNYGSCHTRDTQCVNLWGEPATKNMDMCYSQYNKKGQFYGNCGTFRDNKYIGCVRDDVMCGKLFCNVPAKIKPTYGSLFRQDLQLDNETCTVAYMGRIRGREDKVSYGGTMVYDGTKCGDTKWCKSGQCVEFVRTPCPAPNGVECGGYGSCNDLNQCHCNAGYDPQFNCAILLKVAGWDTKSILIAVMIIVLVILPLAIFGLLMLRKHNTTVHDFFENHTQIRFSVRLPSISRTASTIRKQHLTRQKSASKPAVKPVVSGPSRSLAPSRPTPTASLPTTKSGYSWHPAISSWFKKKTPDYQPVELKPAPPCRPVATYQSPPSRPVATFQSPPSRPIASYQGRSGRSVSTHFPPSSQYHQLAETGDSAHYTSLRPGPPTGATNTSSPAPFRPAPPIPRSVPGSRPSSDVFDNSPGNNKRGPKVLQATTRDNVKLDISQPESARSLVNDRPLDERMFAGSPLREVKR